MPVGNEFVQEVAGLITREPVTTKGIQDRMSKPCSLRAVRYAITALYGSKQIKRGKPIERVRTWVRYDTPVQEYRTSDRFLGI
jgi:hypothetical protein